MASKTKHYTTIEKKIFLEVLKDYKEVVEAKRSDSSTLKEKAAAWIEIGRKYNNSFQINEERTVPQLKKLWTNLKQGQRNALTKEKQASMATGGGPQEPPAVVDPDIAMIVPHLMHLAPVEFSSNVTEDHRNDYQIEITEEDDDDDGTIEYLDEAFLEGHNAVEATVQAHELPGTSSSSSDASILETSTQSRKKLCTPETRQQTSAKSIQSSSTERIQRDTVKLQRIAGIRHNDEELFLIKKQHEMKIAKVKECHLNVMNHMQEEHLMKIQDLELRKATAEAELAELKLSRERENL